MANTQQIITNNQQDAPPRLQYACRECGSVFNSREGLALHLRLHSGDKSLINDLCALTASIPGHMFQGVNSSELITSFFII